MRNSMVLILIALGLNFAGTTQARGQGDGNSPNVVQVVALDE